MNVICQQTKLVDIFSDGFLQSRSFCLLVRNPRWVL